MKPNFRQENEIQLTEEIKTMLKTKFSDRTAEKIKYIVFFLTFTVPEFAEFPRVLLSRMAQYGFYEEFEQGRVIIRQGHRSEK